jgi:hypothetical protein
MEAAFERHAHGAGCNPWRCKNVSGVWVDALPSLAIRYANAAAGSEVLSSRAVRGEEWPTWKRGNSTYHPLLVFRRHLASGSDRSAQSGPSIDQMDIALAMRNRTFILIGDSTMEHMAINLVLLGASRTENATVDVTKRHIPSEMAESARSVSRCWRIDHQDAVDRKEPNAIVCWVSAAKSAGNVVLEKRTLGHALAWVYEHLPLTSADVIVGNVGVHFHPGEAVVRQTRGFRDMHEWFATRLRPHGRLLPRVYYREATPQIWAGGIYPGKTFKPAYTGKRVGYADCLPPWDWKAVQQGLSQPLSLETLLSPEAYGRYNSHVCSTFANSSIRVLPVWEPSALLGSRESAMVGDCTHPYPKGSIVAMWNQFLLQQLHHDEDQSQRRESRCDGAPRDRQNGATDDDSLLSSTGALLLHVCQGKNASKYANCPGAQSSHGHRNKLWVQWSAARRLLSTPKGSGTASQNCVLCSSARGTAIPIGWVESLPGCPFRVNHTCHMHK